MILPHLDNPESCYRRLIKGEDINPSITLNGDDDLFQENKIDSLISEIEIICSRYSEKTTGGKSQIKSSESKNRFDNEVAILLHSHLGLNLEQANQDNFWSYLSIIKTPKIVEARFENRTSNRFICGEKKWKHAYKRLWWRAEIIFDKNEKVNPYSSLENTEEDYWVAVLEREISSCRVLIQKLSERLFREKGEFEMNDRREIVMRMRKLWTSFSIDTIHKNDISDFIEYAIESKPNGLS